MEYLEWVDKKFDENVLPETTEGKQLEVALMKEMGFRNKDLVGKIGSKGYVSSLLSRRKPLTIELARRFHKELNIPTEVLLS